MNWKLIVVPSTESLYPWILSIDLPSIKAFISNQSSCERLHLFNWTTSPAIQSQLHKEITHFCLDEVCCVVSELHKLSNHKALIKVKLCALWPNWGSVRGIKGNSRERELCVIRVVNTEAWVPALRPEGLDRRLPLIVKFENFSRDNYIMFLPAVYSEEAVVMTTRWQHLFSGPGGENNKNLLDIKKQGFGVYNH